MATKTPAEYLEQEFRNFEPLRRHDPDLYRRVEQGLRSDQGVEWVEVAESLRYCTGPSYDFFIDSAARDPRALCWLIASSHFEFVMSGANHARDLRLQLLAVRDVSIRLSELREDGDPWIARMATWGLRVLEGKDRFIGQGGPPAPTIPE